MLERQDNYYEAVNKLYVVEAIINQEEKNEKKLNNVKNRIGLNLSFIGDIKTATEYLEDLLFGNFNKKLIRIIFYHVKWHVICLYVIWRRGIIRKR